MKITVVLELDNVVYEFNKPTSSTEWNELCDTTGTLTIFNVGVENPRCYLKWKSKNHDKVSEEGDNGSELDGVDSELELLLHVIDVSSFKVSQKQNDTTQMTIIEKDGKNHRPLIFRGEQFKSFLDTISQHVSVRPSAGDPSLYLVLDKKVADIDTNLSKLDLIHPSRNASNANLWTFMSEMQNDPYSTAMTAFSKLTDRFIFGDSSQTTSDYMEAFQRSLSLVEVEDNLVCNPDEEDFEVILSKPKFVDELKLSARREPLSSTEWVDEFKQADGSVQNIDKLKQIVFSGGIDPHIRAEVWKCLLGMHEWKLSSEESEDLRQIQVKDYFRMKLQWKSMSEEQESRFVAFRERKTQVEKDAVRTDRAHEFFQGEENVEKLYEILMTYVMYDFDLGYVQGMSDLLSPILYVLRNEVDAFWCFVGFMNKVKSNFDFDQAGIKRQLIAMHDLIKTLDPELYVYLVSKEAENFFFCFRWLLIWFKREFSFEDILKLWEIMWTDLPCKNFHLVLAVSLLHIEKSTIIANNFGFSEILKHMNDKSNTIDLELVLQTAEAIHTKLASEDYLNERLKELLSPK